MRSACCRGFPRSRIALGALLGALFLPSGLDARQVFFPADSTAVESTVPFAPDPITPRGAFIRSLLVPGWGHAATHSFTRGGVYVAAQSAGFWMLGTTIRRRSEAQAFARVERRAVRSRLEGLGTTDPDSILVQVEADPAVQEWDDLVEARSQQVEDWVAFSLFAILIGAVDAYVAAHLMDYPEPLTIRVLPRVFAEGVEASISVPLRRR